MRYYYKLKKYKDAVEPLRKSIMQSPKYAAEGYFRLGISLMKLKHYTPAEEPLRKAVELSPDNEIANDTLAEEISHSPDRFAGFAGLPMQDPDAAARELTRCVRALGFKGATISIVYTARTSVESTAAWYPLPVPISNTRSVARGAIGSVM